ncbi:MAG TPA: hypothetical protein VFI08_02860 [Spirochaetia bacterium]|nr:hypothetical protein [Spirochaetia bacterium]
MTVDRAWQIEFDEAVIAGAPGSSLARILARPGGREIWEGAAEDARRTLAPAAAWDFFPVAEIRHEQVVLSGGARLRGGPIAEVVAGAEELAVAVCTVGDRITERVREHQRSRRLLRGLLLDELGSWAVDTVRQQLCRRLQQEAEASGARTSTSLSPGESEWPVDDQPVLFSLLDTAGIGVTLSPTLLMIPVKSISLILGRGRGPLGREGGSNCDFCVMRERCTYRRRREAPQERGTP